MATMPAHWGQQRRRNDSKGACATTVTAPLQWWQKGSTITVTAPLQQWQRGLHNNVPPQLVAKQDASLPSLHPPPLCWSRCCLACHPLTAVTIFLFVVFVAASSTPFSYGCWVDGVWHHQHCHHLLESCCLSLSSPCPPHQEPWAETWEGGRGCGGDCLGVNTVPLTCCGRAGKASKRIFSWLSLLASSLKTVFICKNSQSYKKNQNWRSSVHVQLNSTYTDNHKLMN